MVTHVSLENHADEREALLAFVEAQRGGLRRAVLGLGEEQAASRPSASELSLSGLLKHAAECELNWLRMAQGRPNERQEGGQSWEDGFRLIDGETIPSVLEFWADVAAQTAAFTAESDLNGTFALPPAPWFPKDGKVSVRWMLLHLVEEFARHAGHADIIRESLDGKGAWDLLALETGQTWGGDDGTGNASA
ncbi:DinB family protein [Streptomyces sp. BI20]|uniref:DinB family protein n=1 Tax=Streptomyces sp. BI20 TaxID=3403460 RepID=UPI003C78BE03